MIESNAMLGTDIVYANCCQPGFPVGATFITRRVVKQGVVAQVPWLAQRVLAFQ